MTEGGADVNFDGAKDTVGIKDGCEDTETVGVMDGPEERDGEVDCLAEGAIGTVHGIASDSCINDGEIGEV